MKPLHIICIVGARPNFIKIAPLMRELRGRPQIHAELIHTGQHFSPEMSDWFFRELEIPEPDVNLGLGGGTHTQQTAEIMRGLEPVFAGKRPDIVLVVGDVNSTMAASLVAAKMGIPIAHVEAGLRSFDRRMPEEINRIVTDALSEWLFITERSAEKNLLAEGAAKEKIFFVGNVMIDTLLRCRDKAAQSKVLENLGLQPGSYAVATLHRPSNVDDPVQLRAWLEMLQQVSSRLPVVFPVHPRTSAAMGPDANRNGRVMVIPPLSYLDFLRLTSASRLVLTDSGGIQEETTVLQVPCLTLRENTERPVTIEQGTNRLAGADPDRALRFALEMLDAPPPAASIPELWDGQAARRIVDVLAG